MSLVLPDGRLVDLVGAEEGETLRAGLASAIATARSGGSSVDLVAFLEAEETAGRVTITAAGRDLTDADVIADELVEQGRGILSAS